MRDAPPLEGRGVLLVGGLFFLGCGLVATVFCYGVVLVVITALFARPGAGLPWLAHVVAGFFTLAGFLAARSTGDEYWGRPEFDTTDQDNRISNVRTSGLSGQFWNVIPFSPRSMGGFLRIVSVPFTLGPRMVLTGVRDLWRAVRGR